MFTDIPAISWDSFDFSFGNSVMFLFVAALIEKKSYLICNVRFRVDFSVVQLQGIRKIRLVWNWFKSCIELTRQCNSWATNHEILKVLFTKNTVSRFNFIFNENPRRVWACGLRMYKVRSKSVNYELSPRFLWSLLTSTRNVYLLHRGTL